MDPLDGHRFGGDDFYGAWAFTNLEPAFRGNRIGKRQAQPFEVGLCPIAERLEARLMQFKTNYFDLEQRQKAADSLYQTISVFDRGV
jgi:perosamine synthetase